MKRHAAVALILVMSVAAMGIAAPSDAVPSELLAGSLGSAVGWAGGFFLGRGLAAAWDLESQPDQKDLVTLTTVALVVTAATSFGVSAAGPTHDVNGSAILSAGGAFLGLIVGMAVEPILALGLSSILPEGAMSSPVLGTAIEVAGVASMVFLPALVSTVGFNLGARDR
jgi:hypothetical protein